MGFKDIKYDITLCHEGHDGQEDFCISLHFSAFLYISLHLSAFLMQFSAFLWIYHAFLCIHLCFSAFLWTAVSFFTIITIIHPYSPSFSIINIIHYYSLLIEIDGAYRRPMDAIFSKNFKNFFNASPFGKK